MLEVFGRPRTPREAAVLLEAEDPSLFLRHVRGLREMGFLVSEKEASRRLTRIAAWNGNLASVYYHVATRDMRFLADGAETERYLTDDVAARRRPRRFKTCDRAEGLALSFTEGPEDSMPLSRALTQRRTVRSFSREKVRLDDLAAVVRGTWGVTGWIDGGPLGLLAAKTSPSAGALHPVECYVLAWNVSGLGKGLYHYDVGADELRRIGGGDPRRSAVRAASGQSWVGDAAFLCVMTAVFERTLWKYGGENAYRALWLDAGHLAQTFALLATARGLGPFQTAAIQDSFLEKLIGLDGVKEFPLYLCGAGVPRPPAGSVSARKERAPARSSSRRARA